VEHQTWQMTINDKDETILQVNVKDEWPQDISCHFSNTCNEI